MEGVMKRDPYNRKEGWIRWKQVVRENGGIPNLSKENSDIILQYLTDMELGLNTAVGSKKGARSFPNLMALKTRIPFIARRFKELYGIDNITQVSEEQLCSFFVDMRNGVLVKADGRRYRAVKDFVKGFKAFWHWWMKVAKKQGKTIEDITVYLDASGEKPEWVYLTEEQVRYFCDNCNFNYKVLAMFLFDTGIRAPTELMNVKVSDISPDFKELNIRDEISKTFGRRIKLMLSSELIRKYIKEKNLSQEDYVFTFHPKTANKYLKTMGKKLFGDEKSPAGQKYSQLTLYDFRHISCCYWLPRYKSESALKYRFGWKKSEKVHYYSEMIGMRDTISEQDLLFDTTKTEIENNLIKEKQKNQVLESQVDSMVKQMEEINTYVGKLTQNIMGLTING